MLDYIRIACAVPKVSVGDVVKNTEEICAYMAKADARNADIVLFPELALTGYTCGDLFFQDTLHKAVKTGLRKIAACTAEYPELCAVIGLPLKVSGGMYNCAAVIAGGKIVGIVPKTSLPNRDEFCEKRWFVSGNVPKEISLTPEELGIEGSGEYQAVPVSNHQLFRIGDAVVGVEICADLMNPAARSVELTVNGAEVILNPSASPETVGKRSGRRGRVIHQSASCCCAYALCSAGCTESTSDLVFSGHSLLAENGTVLMENRNQIDTDYLIVTDCDLGKIRSERVKSQAFTGKELPVIHTGIKALRSDGSVYPLRKMPFVPDDAAARRERCREVFNIQVAALKQRLSVINAKAVVGISGGLDSTLALLVSVEAMRQLGRPATDVYGVTMPCFGTSDRTYQNAWQLMQKLGISSKEISIKNAVAQHFADIGHDSSVHNGTFENAQARERTQILMDYASVVGGIVVGTGDLSELALGWCTYNGDHMSMYGVNASVPKTLIPWIIETVAEESAFTEAKAVLQDILDTPISPELLPPDAQGKISQQTEDIVGPYALHDFFLYYMLRFGFKPGKICTLACRAFAGEYDAATIKKWLRIFYHRFFTQQFKRNCAPDGVKVGSVGLGPRGDWHMPSDASARLWLEEAENL